MRRSIKIAAVIALVMVVIVAGGGPQVLLIPLTLAFGWIKSLVRFASVVQLSGGTVVWFAVLLVMLLVGTHAFCCWVQRTRSRTWRWRWTFGFYAGVVLVLFASAGLVGVAHQTGWMISSPEPIFKRRGAFLKERIRLHNVGREVLQLAQSHGWNPGRVKHELIGPGPRSSWEDFAFYFVGASNSTLDCVILLPRNPKNQGEIGIVERETFHTRPFQELTELLGSRP